MPASEMVGHFARDEQARRSDGTEFPCRKMGVQLVFMYHRCVGTIKHCGKIMMTLMAAKTMLFLSPTTADQVMLVSYLRDISAEKGAQALATKKAVAECLDNNHMLSPPEISTSAGQMTGKTERDLESNASTRRNRVHGARTQITLRFLARWKHCRGTYWLSSNYLPDERARLANTTALAVAKSSSDTNHPYLD